MAEEISNKDYFQDVFKQHYRKIVSYAARYVGDIEEAKEIAQETFATWWENINSIVGNPLPYMFTVAKNKCINYLNREKYKNKYTRDVILNNHSVDLDIVSLCDTYLDKIISDETMQIIENCLESLPEKSREAFRLNREKGLTYKEIADIQGVSVKNIEYRISCVLREIRKKLLFAFVLLGFCASLL